MLLSARALWLFILAFAVLDITLISLCIRSYTVKDIGLAFTPKFTAPVGLSVGHTQHYNLEEPDTDDEWAKLIPPEGHLVHLLDDSGKAKPYTVTMLHQFRCLNAIRKQYIGPADAPLAPLTHCLNYLRQTILCDINMGLESATNVWGTVSKSADYVCRDWTELYRVVEQNQATFRKTYSRSG